MDTQITVDNVGRVLLPKALRKNLRLEPGDKLAVESDGDEIKLRPIRPLAIIKKKRGLWVFQGEPTDASVVDLIDRQREDRLRELSR